MEQMLKALTNMKNWEFVGVTVEFEFPKTREGNGGWFKSFEDYFRCISVIKQFLKSR